MTDRVTFATGNALLLAINAGSSSLKIAGFRVVDGKPAAVLRITVDHRRDTPPAVTGDAEIVSALTLPSHRDDPAFVVALIDALRVPVAGIAHRVVHGGDETRECIALDAAQRARLHALAPLAPLHQPPALAIVDAVAAARPSLPQFACLDTAFHSGMPAVAREYALPADVRARHPQLHAYGFHGLSCRSVLAHLRADNAAGALPERLVIAHLGSGASLTAVRDGRSIATSMGFSALDGLPMATRPGRIDPGLLLYLMRHEHLDADALEELLYRRSGLLGLSGLSGDMRVLLASADPRARAAVDFFVYRTLLETGALAAALGGLDAIVFTGGIGEHQPVIRERIVAGLRWLGPQLQALVLPCDEEAVMAAGVILAT